MAGRASSKKVRTKKKKQEKQKKNTSTEKKQSSKDKFNYDDVRDCRKFADEHFGNDTFKFRVWTTFCECVNVYLNYINNQRNSKNGTADKTDNEQSSEAVEKKHREAVEKKHREAVVDFAKKLCSKKMHVSQDLCTGPMANFNVKRVTICRDDLSDMNLWAEVYACLLFAENYDGKSISENTVKETIKKAAKLFDDDVDNWTADTIAHLQKAKIVENDAAS